MASEPTSFFKTKFTNTWSEALHAAFEGVEKMPRFQAIVTSPSANPVNTKPGAAVRDGAKDIGGNSVLLPRADAEVALVVVRSELLAQNANAVRDKFLALLRSQQLDPEIEKQLIELADAQVTSIFEAWRGVFTLFVRPNIDLVDVCDHLDLRQRKCSQIKHEHVRHRDEKANAAFEQGITDKRELHSFMLNNHEDLMRYGKGYVTANSMWRTLMTYRKALDKRSS
jgi:hypothetical protein